MKLSQVWTIKYTLVTVRIGVVMSLQHEVYTCHVRIGHFMLLEHKINTYHGENTDVTGLEHEIYTCHGENWSYDGSWIWNIHLSRWLVYISCCRPVKTPILSVTSVYFMLGQNRDKSSSHHDKSISYTQDPSLTAFKQV